MAGTRRVYIDGKPWKIRYGCRLRDADGICDYSSQTIKLRSGLHGIDLLDTLIHEVIHARWPDLHEDCVADAAETLSGLIARDFPQVED